MAREHAIEQAVVDRAEAQGWVARKCVYAGRRGSPDRWFMRDGFLVLMEFKKPGEKPDGLQEREHARLKEAGFPVHIVTSIEQGCEILRI